MNQVLLPASLAVRRLYVRVAYRMDEDDGELQLALNGQALNMTKAVPDAPTGERREYFFEVLRKAVAKDAQRDRLTLVGKNVSVFVVSVQAHKPWINPVNGRAYELVRFAGGSDWEAARAIAEKRVFDGAEGRLAQFDPSDTDAIDKLMEHYRPSTPIWLGASGSSSDQASFKWTDGSPMKLDRWHPGVKFPEKQKAPAFLYLRADGRLDHAPLTVSENGVPFGFFVEYGP